MQEHFASWDAVGEVPACEILRGLGPMDLAPVVGEAPPTRLFGLDLVNGTRTGVACALADAAELGHRLTVQFINAHCVNVLEQDASYRAALQAADYLLPDGSGLTIAARLAGVDLGENLNGTDLFPEVCREAAARGVSVFLLGGAPGVASVAASAMRRLYPDLRIAGTRHGFWQEYEESALIAELNASGAGILLVGMGVPRQEKWIAARRHRLSASVVMGVGGLFDYYSGAIPRAPRLLRATGMEWVWRLAQEPKRLFARYILGNPVFLAGAVRHALAVRRVALAVSRRAKLAFDRIVACVALAALSPLFAAIALAIVLEDRGPVFFRQTRIGEKGRPFRMWKFRSMVVDAEARLAQIATQSEREGNFKMKRDPRVTRVGALLRRTSLDELPQLINILRGQMSIVGPRPALPREVVDYDDASRQRLDGLPGLTCTWQVSGRADIPFEQQVRLDVDYLQKRTLWGDIKLIFKTIPAVITARGAY